MALEKPQQPQPGPRELAGDFGGVYAANALVAFIFATTGPVAILLAVATRGGLSEGEISSWMFGSFYLNGFVSVVFCWLYRQPLVFFWTIPGAVLVGPALGHLSFAEVVGAYHVCGVLMLALGLSGWVRRAMQAVPMPIVMAMVAGVFMRFGLDMVFAVRDDFVLAAPMVAVFILLSTFPRAGRVMPPLIGALLTGAAIIWLVGSFKPGAGALFAFAKPALVAPVFSVQALVELVVPLAITVLVVQNGQGVAILANAGHPAPVNAVATACGVGSLASALVGAVPTCLTGPVSAIISSSGDRARHYTAGIAVAFLGMAFGLLGTTFTRLMLATPAAFIATLGGLAMLRVLQTAFVTSFKDRFTLGALVTFLVTVANVPIANISAPFWGLVFGFTVSWLLERGDFKSLQR